MECPICGLEKPLCWCNLFSRKTVEEWNERDKQAKITEAKTTLESAGYEVRKVGGEG